MKYFIIVLLFFYLTPTFATTEKYRIMWRDDPSTSMVIGWNQVSGINPTVYYGPVDHGTNYLNYPSSKTVDRTVSAYTMDNRFARLTGLQANTAYYFVIVDSDGTSDRFWFKTTPDDPSIRLSFLAGGDSRNNRPERQNANKIVQSLRPHAVLFGGDYTSTNTNTQWINWMDDWQLTTGTDGRMIPIVATRGNHENNNNVIINMFDVAYADNYYKTIFGGGLVSAYTLNTEISIGGTQATWLDTELAADQSIYKIAQYHKPVRSHTSGKAEGTNQYLHWVPLFDQYDVDLVVECDSHTGKSTWPIKASTGAGSDEGFIRDDNDGTVYVGEGCWGAPLRNNDDDKTWTRNSGMFNQVKWIFIDQVQIEVRTILTDNAMTVGVVDDNDIFSPPNNLNIWNPSNGDVIIIPNNTVDVDNSIALHEYEACEGTTISSIPNDLSGITYNPMTRTYFTVFNNNPESVQELDANGSQLRNIILNGFNDTEGITHIAGTTYAVTEEQVGKIIFIDIPNGSSEITINYPANSEQIQLGGTWVGNDGLEGIVYDKTNDKLYVAKERTPMAIYEIDNPIGNKGSTVTLEEPFDLTTMASTYPANGGFSDIAGLGITDEGHLLLLSHEGQSLVEVLASTGQLISHFDLLPTGMTQAEGVVLNANEEIIVVGEPNEFWEVSKFCGSVCSSIASGPHDVEENANGSIYINSSDIELVNDGNRGNQVIGLEFNGLNLPPGAMITNAQVQFTSDNVNSNIDPCNLMIYADQSGIPNSIGINNNDLSSRTKTQNARSWSPPSWTSTLTAGANQLTPDISSVLQEVIDEAANVSVDKIILIIEGTGRRTAASYDQGATYGPALCIEYTSPECVCTTPANVACSRSASLDQNKNYWVGPANGNWFGDYCNWSKQCFPSPCDDVVIDMPGVIVNMEADDVGTIYSLELKNGARLNVPESAELILTEN